MSERTSTEPTPEACLKLGRDLLKFAPERCKGCAHALQGTCEVARLAIERAINPDTAEVYTRVVLRGMCDPELTGAENGECAFVTEPSDGYRSGETVAEAIVDHVTHVNRVLPDRVPLQHA